MKSALLIGFLLSLTLAAAVTVDLDKTDYSAGDMVRINIGDCVGSSLLKIFNVNNDLVDIKSGSGIWSASYNTLSDASKGAYMASASCENGKLDQKFCVAASGCLGTTAPQPRGGTRQCAVGSRLVRGKCVRTSSTTSPAVAVNPVAAASAPASSGPGGASSGSSGGGGGGGGGSGGSRSSASSPRASPCPAGQSLVSGKCTASSSSASTPTQTRIAGTTNLPSAAPGTTSPVQQISSALQKPAAVVASSTGTSSSTVFIIVAVVVVLALGGGMLYYRKMHASAA